MLFLGVVLLIGVYALLPPLLEVVLAKNLQSQLKLDEKPEVNLEGNPLSVVGGRFEGGRITFGHPDLGGIHPDKVTVDLDPFNLDMLGSVTSGRIKSDGPLSGSLNMQLSKEEITRIAASTRAVEGVELEEGQLVVDLEAGGFGPGALIGVEGNLVLRNGVLHFEPSRAQAFGASIPQRLLSEASFSYPISGLLFGGTLSDLEVHKDRLVLSGKVDSLLVG